MEEVRREVWSRVEALREAGIELLRELVRIDSTNPKLGGVVGGETRCNEVLRERYADAGLATHWVAEDPERRNLVGVRGGAGGGRSLILNGHVDTVAAVDPEHWAHGSPWSAEIHDGRLYGLGATDMKGADTSMWLAAQALHDAGVELQGELQLHSVVAEESMQHELGTTACVRAGFRADAAIVTEPTSYPRPLTVSPVAGGNWWFRVVVEGKSTHCANRPLAIRPGGPGDEVGVNALEKGIKIVTALQDLELEWGLTKAHPYFSPGFFTILPGSFASEPGLPYFSSSAAVEFIAWYPPDHASSDVIGEIEDYVTAASRLDSWLREHPPRLEWLNHWPPSATPWEDPLVQTVVRAHEAATGEQVSPPSPQNPVNFGAASDGAFLERQGIPTVIYGPGDLKVAHCMNENVALDEVVTAAKTLAASALEWCGTT